MKIAIVGAGIAGLTAAHRLGPDHEVTIFEAGAYAGGHTNTVQIEESGRTFAVDTGFIVCNDRTYPNFLTLLAELGVATQPTHMGFSVSSRLEDFEYAGTPRGIFCQARNLTRPSFLRMLADLVRFNRALARLVAAGDNGPTLGDVVRDGHFSTAFVERLLVPQVASVWSMDPAQVWDFPALFLAQFFRNHGMLSLRDRPQWLTVRGGSAVYVEALLKRLRGTVLLATPVTSITRTSDSVEIRSTDRAPAMFDEVILACHSDQALALLADPSAAETEILGAIAYQDNEAVLHTDTTLLPRRRSARQSWNYHLVSAAADGRPVVTYWMNRLQRLDAEQEYCVTLNLTGAIKPESIIRTIQYAHPIYSLDSVAAQQRHAEISGVRRTHYAGAYWRWGFHEDGVWSALRAVDVLRASAKEPKAYEASRA